VEELYALYCAPNVILVINQEEIGWACRTYGVEEKCVRGFGGETLRKGDHLGEIGVDGMIVLEWILKKGRHGLDYSGSE